MLHHDYYFNITIAIGPQNNLQDIHDISHILYYSLSITDNIPYITYIYLIHIYIYIYTYRGEWGCMNRCLA